MLEAEAPSHHLPPAGGTDLRYKGSFNGHSTFPYRHSGLAGPTDEMTLSALVDLGVPLELLKTDLKIIP